MLEETENDIFEQTLLALLLFLMGENDLTLSDRWIFLDSATEVLKYVVWQVRLTTKIITSKLTFFLKKSLFSLDMFMKHKQL